MHLDLVAVEDVRLPVQADLDSVRMVLEHGGPALEGIRTENLENRDIPDNPEPQPMRHH
jgi:hypothetical protein